MLHLYRKLKEELQQVRLYGQGLCKYLLRAHRSWKRPKPSGFNKAVEIGHVTRDNLLVFLYISEKYILLYLSQQPQT